MLQRSTLTFHALQAPVEHQVLPACSSTAVRCTTQVSVRPNCLFHALLFKAQALAAGTPVPAFAESTKGQTQHRTDAQQHDLAHL
jgi:hypothetical protein